MKIRTREITCPDGRREVVRWFSRSKKSRRENHRMRKALIRRRKSDGSSYYHTK